MHRSTLHYSFNNSICFLLGMGCTNHIIHSAVKHVLMNRKYVQTHASQLWRHINSFPKLKMRNSSSKLAWNWNQNSINLYFLPCSSLKQVTRSHILSIACKLLWIIVWIDKSDRGHRPINPEKGVPNGTIIEIWSSVISTLVGVWVG